MFRTNFRNYIILYYKCVYLLYFLYFTDIFKMDQNLTTVSTTNEINQPTVDQWKGDPDSIPNNTSSVSDINEQNIETLNNTSINDNTITENATAEEQEKNNESNVNGNTWPDQFVQKDHDRSKDNSGYRKGRGGFNKSNHNNNFASNNFHNKTGQGRGRGRGRGFLKKFNDVNESFGDGHNPSYHNHGDNSTQGHRGRGRGHHRGRGRNFREKSDDWHGNNVDGSKKKENDKSIGPKPEYIPPDIENEESIAGIEAGLNFDKYETIEVKVSGTDPPKRLNSFHSSGLHNILLDNLSICNFSTPTPIQNYAVPIVIAGRDLMASAQTGSGKTVSLFTFQLIIQS